jgi:hypothetical protein
MSIAGALRLGVLSPFPLYSTCTSPVYGDNGQLGLIVGFDRVGRRRV